MQPAIEIKNLTYAYIDDEETEGTQPPGANSVSPPSLRAQRGNPPRVLTDINLSIDKSTITVIIGPSGCGKTTLCKCMTGIIPKAIGGDMTGEVIISGTEIAGDSKLKLSRVAEDMGLVMQEPDHQIVMTTAEDDIAFAPENLMVEPERVRQIVDENIALVGLPGKARTNPMHLSGGEKQKLAIAGILAMGSDIIVFDEPMSSLDKSGREMFCRIIKQLKQEGKTVIIVEHDYEQLDFADIWVIMKQGRIISTTAPDEADRNLLERELWL